MKPTLRKVTPHPGYSFTVRRDNADGMTNNWHYHPEFELLYIKRSAGTWLIGDHVGPFQSGDIVLLGSGLPHCYKHDPEFLSKTAAVPGESIGVLFLANIFGEVFLNMPEMSAVRHLLQKSSKGLKITGNTQKKCAALLEDMVTASPAQRLLRLIAVLDTIAETREYNALSSGAFSRLADTDHQKIKSVFEYTLHHFDEKIRLEEVAALVCMTPHSFCRFFKRKTKKTYVQFLLEVRIGMACKLLVEEEKNVAEVCYTSGFNNLSHFHTHFKKITGLKPLQYRTRYIDKKEP